MPNSKIDALTADLAPAATDLVYVEHDPVGTPADRKVAVPNLAYCTSGTLAARPAAATFGRGWYLATDDDGGTLYYSDGTSWTQTGPGVTETAGRELGYAEATASQTFTSTTFTDATGLTTTVTVGARPIIVEGYVSYVTNSVAGNYSAMSIVEDGTAIGFSYFDHITTNAKGALLHVKRRRAPSAGSHTYKLQGARSAGNSVWNMDSGAAFAPGFIRVVEC